MHCLILISFQEGENLCGTLNILNSTQHFSPGAPWICPGEKYPKQGLARHHLYRDWYRRQKVGRREGQQLISPQNSTSDPAACHMCWTRPNSSRACLTVRFTDVCFPEVRNRKQTESGLPNRAADSAKNEWHVQQNDLRANLDLGMYSGLVRACCTLHGQVWVWKTPGANSAALSLFKQPARTEKPVARSLHVPLIFLQLRPRHRHKHFFSESNRNI